MLGSAEPEIAWGFFRSTLFSLVDTHIPKITIKNNFQSPWFDSEVYHAYLKKERAHSTKNDSDLQALKFSTYRRKFKELAAEKCGITCIIQRILPLLLKNFGHMLNLIQRHTVSLIQCIIRGV